MNAVSRIEQRIVERNNPFLASSLNEVSGIVYLFPGLYALPHSMILRQSPKNRRNFPSIFSNLDDDFYRNVNRTVVPKRDWYSDGKSHADIVRRNLSEKFAFVEGIAFNGKNFSLELELSGGGSYKHLLSQQDMVALQEKLKIDSPGKMAGTHLLAYRDPVTPTGIFSVSCKPDFKQYVDLSDNSVLPQQFIARMREAAGFNANLF